MDADRLADALARAASEAGAPGVVAAVVQRGETTRAATGVTTGDGVALVPVGATSFTSTRPDGQGTDTWDFVDPDDRGVPTGLLTQRIHRRVG